MSKQEQVKSGRRSVGLVGPMGSGKSTLAAALVGYGWEHYALADELKWVLARVLGRPIDKSVDRPLLQEFATDICRNPDWAWVADIGRDDYLEQDLAVSRMWLAMPVAVGLVTEDVFCEHRAMERLHRELFAVDGPRLADGLGEADYWVARLVRRMPLDRPVVVSDVRFPNEAAALRDAGCAIVGVVCPEPVRTTRVLKRDGVVPREHASETGYVDISTVDFYVEGYGDALRNATALANALTDFGLAPPRVVASEAE